MDVVVIGAGIAGLAALERARERGLEAVALEAGRRIGGRALTDHATFAFPFDRGCHWLHCADRNPLTTMAEARGYTFERARPTIVTHLGERWATPEEERERARYAGACYEAVGAAEGDVSVASVCDRTSRWWPFFASYSTAAAGVSPERSSTLDFNRYEETPEHWPVREGFGALVAEWGRDLPVRLDTPVTAVDFGGDGVRVEGPRGTLKARAAIVTVSTAVLGAEAIRFTPPIGDKIEAARGLPLGHANKVGLSLSPGFYAGTGIAASPPTYALAGARDCIHFELRPFGWDAAVAFLAGEEARVLERAGAEAMIARATEGLRQLFGSHADRAILRAATTAWSEDARFGGAYSAALPGRADARAVLAEPLAERLFFAGEAVSRGHYSTAQGAYLSGRAAVEAFASAGMP